MAGQPFQGMVLSLFGVEGVGVDEVSLAEGFEVVEGRLPCGTDFILAHTLLYLLAEVAVAGEFLEEVAFEEEIIV